MPQLSIWEYLRQRTRDAVLAGFQDALDVTEQNDQADSEYEAATKLRRRLGAASALALPGRSAQPPVVVPERQRGSPAEAVPERQGSSPAEAARNTVDDLIDARLNGAVTPPAGKPPVPDPQLHPIRRKRGRPPKDAPR